MARGGDYQAIHTVLVDDPDFQALSPHGKLLVYTLKMILGPSGIDVVRAFEDQLQELTGLKPEELAEALNELADSAWLRHQGRIVWLRNGLRYNPSLTLENTKHRDGVLRHLRSLPASQIVNAFASYYKLPEVVPGMGTEWVSHGYGKQEVRSKKSEEEVGITDNDLSNDKSAASAEQVITSQQPDDDPSPLTIHQQAMPVLRELGFEAKKQDGSILKAMAKKGLGWDKLEPAVRGLAAMRDEGGLREWMGLEPGEELSLRILYARDGPKDGAKPVWRVAEDRWYQQMAREQRNDRKKMPRLAV